MAGARRWRAGAAGVLGAGAVLVMASCGLPGDGHAQRVDDDDVPYRLLDSAVPAPSVSGDGGTSNSTPLVFWLRDDDRLIPTAADASCRERSQDSVERVLGELGAGPRDDARAAGRSTAIPPGTVLDLVSIQDGTATVEVEVDPATPISADRLPAAVGQIVMSAASAPGVQSVLLVNADGPVSVPLPGGALTDRPVTAEDYADLLPHREQGAQGGGCAPS
ncbi:MULTISPECIES: GerMN domain-containing protein [unclassified Nocardioides]|uniref:GerMN domain-containing protein n=1 Tax=unclassified Nocardioides TaxID=2615069 RepID=UPI0009F0E521|nr:MULTISPECIES: GerMN domain-containing protein [unclassified Nocardioides]GAW52251.1 uncharacterized protein PD653B2_4603 [Nocardioides sp. PD653-B2]GAW56064.1 uncharacterized protein PD653_3497 [Nocardioides sp. PD653]